MSKSFQNKTPPPPPVCSSLFMATPKNFWRTKVSVTNKCLCRTRVEKENKEEEEQRKFRVFLG